jgi:hypothetical protein
MPRYFDRRIHHHHHSALFIFFFLQDRSELKSRKRVKATEE